MITIIVGLPRRGKTIHMTHIATREMFNRDRLRKMHMEIDRLNSGGFSLSKPRHPVVANFDIVGNVWSHGSAITKNQSVSFGVCQ